MEDQKNAVKFLTEKVNKAADRISELESIISGLCYDIGKVTVCKNVKSARQLAINAIDNAQNKIGDE